MNTEEILKFVVSLPLPAVMSFGGVLGLVFSLARLGILDGRKVSPAHDAPTAQVAAVIVDPSALNAATAQLSRLTAAIERQTDVFEKLAGEIERVREEIRDLSREVSRRN